MLKAISVVLTFLVRIIQILLTKCTLPTGNTLNKNPKVPNAAVYK
jgi:hypothetical protein